MEWVPKLLSCIICDNNVLDLITLQCLHSICKTCFDVKREEQQEGNIDSNTKILINCAVCVYTTSFEKDDATNWKRFSNVQSVLKALLDTQNGLDSAVCISCKNRGKSTKSFAWCFDCIDYFCKDCLDVHSSFPLLNQHKIINIGVLKEDLGPLAKARERCDKHNLRFTKFCNESECACCDRCLSMEHIDVCKGEHKEIKDDIVAKLVDPKVTELQKMLQKTLQDLETQVKDTTLIKSKTEEFFKDKQHKANEEVKMLSKRVLASTDSLLAESYKLAFYKLQEIEAPTSTLTQKKSVLQNAVDIVSALQCGSDVRYFLELKKVRQILKDSVVVLENEQHLKKYAFSISFDKSLDTFCSLKEFGEISETRLTANKENSLSIAQSKFGSDISDVWPTLSSSSEWDSELSLSSVETEDERSKENFKFGEKMFIMSKSINVEKGNSHVTGCAWKSENEIMIVDQTSKMNGKPKLCVYDIQSGNMTKFIYLDGKPYDVSILPNDQFVISFPKEMKVGVYNLSDYSLKKKVDVGIKCYGVHYCRHKNGNATCVAGENQIVLFDAQFNLIRRLGVRGEDIRYIFAYSKNLLFYSGMLDNAVYCAMGDGSNLFTYEDKDELKTAAGLILDESRNVYVCVKEKRNILVISKSGSLLRKIEVGECPTTLSLSKDNDKLCIICGGKRFSNVADIYISK